VLPLSQITAQLGVIGITLNTILKKYVAISNNPIIRTFQKKDSRSRHTLLVFRQPGYLSKSQQAMRLFSRMIQYCRPAATYVD
jgi:hypothetical protein